MAGNDAVPGDGCTGGAADPVAAGGFVRIYVAASLATNFGDGYSAAAPDLSNFFSTGDGSRFGSGIIVGGTGFWRAHGTWAHTAPWRGFHTTECAVGRLLVARGAGRVNEGRWRRADVFVPKVIREGASRE